MNLHEKVCIKTPAGELHGELFVGKDGLPELEVAPIDGHRGIHAGYQRFRPATFPAEWRIHWKLLDNPTMVLMHGWDAIDNLRKEIQDAQREAEDFNG